MIFKAYYISVCCIGPCLSMTSMACKSHKINYTHRKQQKLFNQSYNVKITPLIIYGLGAYTHMRTYPHKSDFKKPAMRRPVASAPGLNGEKEASLV